MENKEIDAYKEWIVVNKRCLELISDISEFFHKKSKWQGERKDKILHAILMRHTMTLTSVALLAKSSVLQRRATFYKLPIGLLLRNCYMDGLLGLYFCSLDEANVEEVANSLNLDYVKALFEEFEVYRDKIPSKFGWNNEFVEHMYTMSLEDTFLSDFSVNKSPDKIVPGKERELWKVRPKTDVRTLIPEKDVKQELNVKTIYLYLANNETYSSCANNLYAYYKYFSQYEHFSENGFGDAIAAYNEDNINMEAAILRISDSIKLMMEKVSEK